MESITKKHSIQVTTAEPTTVEVTSTQQGDNILNIITIDGELYAQDTVKSQEGWTDAETEARTEAERVAEEIANRELILHEGEWVLAESIEGRAKVTIVDAGCVVSFLLVGDRMYVINSSGTDVSRVLGGKLNSATVTEQMVYDLWIVGYDGDPERNGLRVEID